MLCRHVLAHGVALVAVNAAFALLEVYGIRRQVPVHNRVAVGVEVQAFLADGSGRKDKGPEGRVEGLAHLSFAGSRLAVVAFLSAEAHGEVAPQATVLDPDDIAAGLNLIHAWGACPE